MPAALNQAGIVRDRATAGVLRGYLGEGDRTTIALSRKESRSMLSQIDRQLSWAAANVPLKCARASCPHFEKARDAFTTYSAFVEQMLLQGRNGHGDRRKRLRRRRCPPSIRSPRCPAPATT